MTSRDLLKDKLAEVYSYYGSGLYQEFLAMLVLLEKTYDEDFRTVSPEGLKYKQGAAAQLRLLTDCLLKKTTQDLPKV